MAKSSHGFCSGIITTSKTEQATEKTDLLPTQQQQLCQSSTIQKLQLAACKEREPHVTRETWGAVIGAEKAGCT
jgi:hypothetical protein